MISYYYLPRRGTLSAFNPVFYITLDKAGHMRNRVKRRCHLYLLRQRDASEWILWNTTPKTCPWFSYNLVIIEPKVLRPYLWNPQHLPRPQEHSQIKHNKWNPSPTIPAFLLSGKTYIPLACAQTLTTKEATSEQHSICYWIWLDCR